MGIAIIAMVAQAGCAEPAPVRQIITDLAGSGETWEEAFTGEHKIHLKPPEEGTKLLQISRLAIRGDGNLVIPDARNKRILIFQLEGTLVRQLEGGKGGDFKLSLLRTVAVDPSDNIIVYDADGHWVTVLQAPEYHRPRRFQIPAPVAQISPLPDGSFLAYSPTEERVFQRFDRNGKRLGAVHRISDEELRLFHARVQTGGIVTSTRGDVIGIHPAAFELVRMSAALEVKEILRPSQKSRWHSDPKRFPSQLNPYDYTPAHEEWWDTFDHIGTIHSLRDELLLVTVYSSSGLNDWRERVNIYHLGQRVRLLAQGLEVPHRARIVGARGRDVYIARNARMGEHESLEPLELYRYRLNMEAN